MENTDDLPQSGDMSRHDAPERDTSRHTLTIKQAAHLFEEYGVPRSPRSVQRFCEQNHLDCIRVQGDKTERYFIDPRSVGRYAEELKQLDHLSQLGSDVSRHNASQRDTSRHDAPAPTATIVLEPADKTDRETEQLRDQLDIVKKENVQLRIDLGARVFFIEKMGEERQGFIERISNQGRDIGRLETKLLLLEEPKEPVSRHDPPDDVEPVAAVVVEQGSGETENAQPVPVSPTVLSPESRPGFFRRVFGGK